MAVQFAVLGSGSRGNSTWVRGRGAGLLIDVGMGPKVLGERLESVGASWAEVGAVAITHTHGDHVDSAAFMEVAKRNILLYCHDGHRAELTNHPGYRRLEARGLVRLFDEIPFLTQSGLRVEPIRLMHDGGPTFGFRLEVSGSERRGRTVGIGYLADTGTWSQMMADSVADVDILGVEFNHDIDLQRSSGRPWFLIQRNLGKNGHLSNCQGVEFVNAVLERSRRSIPRHLVLLHLSQDCNLPDLAVRAAREGVTESGRRMRIHAALQSPAHPNLWVEPGGRRGFVQSGPWRRPASTEFFADKRALTQRFFGFSEWSDARAVEDAGNY
jgi:phosphoribosyl 1,2-cyclic phosphodiesterase